MRTLNPREKTLSLLVGGVFFLLINLVFIRYIVNQRALVKAEFAAQTQEWESMQKMLEERSLWEKREAWLAAKQPKLTNESGAGVELLDSIKTAAKAENVTIENPAIANPEKAPQYRASPVNFETKSSWPALIKFLAAVQQPERFVVFDSANIQIETSDPTLIRGKFRVSRWYAP